MYKYLLFEIPEDKKETRQIFSSNDYHSVLSWIIDTARNNNNEFVIVNQSACSNFRQALH